MSFDELIAAARRVREHAHAPYSEFRVGSALLTQSGQVFVGCNVENASYGGTICAERSAVCAMVAAGEREIAAIVVYTDTAAPVMPCGICRQVLHELGPDAVVIAATPHGSEQTTLAELLPRAFRFER